MSTRSRAPIRRATIDECAEIARLETLFFKEHGFSRSQLLGYRRRPRTFVLVALGETSMLLGYIVGSVYQRGETPTLWIISMAVLPAHRRNGLGSRLIKEAIRRGRMLGARRVKLEVARGERRARRFYLSCQFRDESTLPEYYGPNRSAIRMSRKV